MRIENDIKLDFKDVLIRPKRSTLKTRSGVSLIREYKFRNSGERYVGVPIMAANMDGVGTIELAKAIAIDGMFTCLTKHYTVMEVVNNFISDNLTPYAAVTIGLNDDDLEKLRQIATALKSSRNPLQYICLDAANGYTERFVDRVKELRELYPYQTIIAGNVVTAEMTEELILSGADIVKVGIGPGSVCTTRIKTGVGYPQLSAIIECADAAHGLGGHIIADGGCTSPGDVAKAFGAGADFVMLGGMLAGHNEGGGQIIDNHVRFYGMSSKAANDKHFGGLKDYRSSEGREVLIPYKGKVRDTIQDILGGLRSACTYVGASELKYLSKCTTFIRVTQQYNGVFERN